MPTACCCSHGSRQSGNQVGTLPRRVRASPCEQITASSQNSPAPFLISTAATPPGRPYAYTFSDRSLTPSPCCGHTWHKHALANQFNHRLIYAWSVSIQYSPAGFCWQVWPKRRWSCSAGTTQLFAASLCSRTSGMPRALSFFLVASLPQYRQVYTALLPVMLSRSSSAVAGPHSDVPTSWTDRSVPINPLWSLQTTTCRLSGCQDFSNRNVPATTGPTPRPAPESPPASQ